MGALACHACIHILDSLDACCGCTFWAMLYRQSSKSAAISLILLLSEMQMWHFVQAIAVMSAGLGRPSDHMVVLLLMQASNDLLEAFENPQVIRHPRGRLRSFVLERLALASTLYHGHRCPGCNAICAGISHCSPITSCHWEQYMSDMSQSGGNGHGIWLLQLL